MSWWMDCYVRTPESHIEIFTAPVGKTVRLSGIVKRWVGIARIPIKDVEVRFFKNNVQFATGKTRADGWADGDYTITSGDIGTIVWRVEAWDRGVKVAKAVSDAPFTVPEEGVVPPVVPPEEEVPSEVKCFIVTACFDSLKVAQVQRLRTFRDSCLPRQVTQLYYCVSPPVARFLRCHKTLRVAVRKLIERLLLSPIRVYNKPTFEIRKDPNNPTKLEVLGENLLDALIDGCIAGLMTGWLVWNPDVGWKAALAVGLLKFFIRLKELRGK